MKKILIAAVLGLALAAGTATAAEAAPSFKTCATMHVEQCPRAVVTKTTIKKLIKTHAKLHGYLFTVSKTGRIDAWEWK